MSKTKNKNHSEIEHLRGQLKSEKSKNRQLRKRIRELEKRQHMFEDLTAEAMEDLEVKEEKCQDCGKGTLMVVDLKHVKFLVCDHCHERTKL